MRIGFDVSQTGRLKAGCGFFADSLIVHLAEIEGEDKYILYPTFGDVYWDSSWPTGTREINRPNFRRGLAHRTFEAAKLFWSNPPSDIEVRLGSPDIVHANNFSCPVGLRKARLVYTLYDLSFLEHPEWTTEENRIGCFGGVFNASLYADLIVAISEYSRRHFLGIFPHYPADRVVVIYPASRFLTRGDVSRPGSLPPLQPHQFWLNVGTLEPRKNQRGLLRAYARLKAHLGKPFPLAMAGSRGWLMDDFEQTVDELGLRQDVLLLGYVDDATLQWLYQYCFAFVFPSLFEGFGLPVLEAMSLGAVAIASEVTSIPEIVGDAGILVDPLNEEAIYRAMLHLSGDAGLRSNLKARAMQQATKFNWTAAASAILGCYREVLSHPGRVP